MSKSEGARLPIANSELYMLVDEADFITLSCYSWYLNRGYARARVAGTSRQIYAQRLLMPVGPGQEIDHINGNKLDNRRENLRSCTRSQNLANRRIAQVNSSGFKGVSFFKKSGKWTAQIRHNYKLKTLGEFECKLSAARAYDDAAKKLFGEFAQLNFPEAA